MLSLAHCAIMHAMKVTYVKYIQQRSRHQRICEHVYNINSRANTTNMMSKIEADRRKAGMKQKKPKLLF